MGQENDLMIEADIERGRQIEEKLIKENNVPFSGLGFRKTDYNYAENQENFNQCLNVPSDKFQRPLNFHLAEEEIINNLVDINNELHDSVRIGQNN